MDKKNFKYRDYIKTVAILIFYDKNTKKQTRKVNKLQPKGSKAILIGNEIKRVLNQKTPYYKVKDKYGEVKQSIIYNITIKESKDIARIGEQQSFVFGINNEGILTFELWVNASKKEDKFKYIKVNGKTNLLDNNLVDYSQIVKVFKFSIPFERFESLQDELIDSYNNSGLTEEEIQYYIKESMNDDYSEKYRNNCRIKLFGKVNDK